MRKLYFENLYIYSFDKARLEPGGIAEYFLIDLENREACGDVHDYLQNIASGRTVSTTKTLIYFMIAVILIKQQTIFVNKLSLC